MARELKINIRTEADLTQLNALATAFDRLESSLTKFDNRDFLTGLGDNLVTFKTQINEVTAEVKELATALDQLGGRGGIKGFQQALGKGINVNLKGAKVAYKDVQTIAAETTAEIDKTNANAAQFISALREVGRQQRLNERQAAKIRQQDEDRANAQKAAEKSLNQVLEQRNTIMRQARVGVNAVSRMEEEERRLTSSLTTQMERREQALEAYRRAQERMQRTAGTARPEDMSAINRDLEKALGDLRSVNNQLQSAQSAWGRYGRSVQDNIVKVEDLVNALKDQYNQEKKLEQADRAAGRDSAADARLRTLDQITAQMKEQEGIQKRLNTLLSGGQVQRRLPGGATLSYDARGVGRTMIDSTNTMADNAAAIQRVTQSSEQYKRSIQEVKTAEAQRAAQFKESIAGMQRFANQLKSLAASLSNFASTIRSRVNTIPPHVGQP